MILRFQEASVEKTEFLLKKEFYLKTSPADKQPMRPRATFEQELSFPGDYQPPQALLILF